MYGLAQLNAGKVTHQMLLEELYHKNQLIPRIKQVFLSEDNFHDKMKELDLNPKFALDFLVQMVLHKRTTFPIIIGILRHHYDDLQECADNVVKAILAGLCDYNSTTKQLIIKYDIPKEVQDDIDKFQFPLPMVVSPKHINSNKETGYISDPVNKGSIILKKNYHTNDVCLDHINRMNRVKFTLNFDTANMVKNKWRNLDKPKPNETRIEYNRRVKAFNKYQKSAYDVINLIVAEGNEFYLTHRYDKRGRTYCQGYHINYQGTEWNKACVELANKELVL